MPGISLYHSSSPLDEKTQQAIASANRLLVHNERYVTRLLFRSAHTVVNFTAYSQYCHLDFSTDKKLCFVEGAIYNRDRNEVQQDLGRIATALSDDPDRAPQLIAEWIANTDGEFIVLIGDKVAGRFSLFNDSLGRLPLFKHSAANALCLSREPKFAVAAAGLNQPDRLAFAQYLNYGFNLGNRTLSLDIRRVPPAQLLQFDPSSSFSRERTTYSWDFQACVDSSLRAAVLAPKLAQVFLDSTKNRVQTLQPRLTALALSGGLDSRAVLAALERARLPYWAHSNLTAGQTPNYDFRITKKLADKVGHQLTAYPLSEPTHQDYRDLALQNEGAGSAIMAMAMVHFRLLRRDHGDNLCLYTGDGGGNIMYPLTPAKPIASIDDLLNATLHTICFTPLETVARLLRLSTAEILASNVEAFAEYPESDPTFKYARYKIFGRPWRFIMEGEDRVRFHFWLAAPFWNPEMLRLMMSLPDCEKVNYRLYREFLGQLYPQVLQVPYANIRTRIDSPWIGLHNHIKRTILSRPWLYHRVRVLRDPKDYDPAPPPILQAEIDRVLRTSQLLPEYFDVAEVRKFLSTGASRISYHLLASLILRTHLIEHNFCPPAE